MRFFVEGRDALTEREISAVEPYLPINEKRIEKFDLPYPFLVMSYEAHFANIILCKHYDIIAR